MPVIDVLAWTLIANTKPLLAGLGVGTSKLKVFAAGMGGVALGAAALGAVLVVLGVKAAKMAAQLDKALAAVSTLLPVTTAGLQDVRKAIVAMSTRVPQTPVQLTEALYQAISAGARDTAEALFLVETAAKAAVAGQSDTETAVKAITTVLNAYQLDISEATRVSDVFFKTIEQGVIVFPEIAATIGNVATTAALAGVTVEELGAAMATLTKFGNNAARSTTQLNALLLSLVSATKEQRALALDKFGIDFSVANLKASGLVGFLQQLEEATRGDIEALAELFPKIRAAKGVFVLAGAGAQEFRDILELTKDSTGSAEAAFEKMKNTAGPLFDLFKNKLNVVFFEFGEKILKGIVIPALQLMNKLLPELADETSNFALQIENLNFQMTNMERLGALLKIMIKGGFAIVGGELPRDEVKELILSFTHLKDFSGVIDPVEIQLISTLPLEEQIEKLEELRERAAIAVAAIIKQPPFKGFLATGEESIFVKQTQAKLDLIGAEVEIIDRIIDGVNRSLAGLDDVLDDAGGGIGNVTSAVDALREAWELQMEANNAATAALASFAEHSEDARERGFVKELEKELALVDSMGLKALVVSGLLKKWKIDVSKMSPAMQKLLGIYEDLDLASANVATNAADLADKIGTAARAMVELGAAVGLLPDSMARVVSQLDLVAKGVIGIVEGIQSGASIGALAGPIGIALGGIAGLAGGLLGTSPQEQARIESQEANTDRLRRLSSSVDRLREAMFSLPGALAGKLLGALQEGGAERGLSGLDDLRNIPRGDETFQRALDLAKALKEAGLSASEVERIAEGLGIEADRLVEFLSGDFSGGRAEYEEILEQAQSLLRGLGLEVENFFDTLAGKLELANQRIALFDIEDPIDQIAEFVKVLESSGTALSAADLERLRAGDEQLIQELVDEISTRTGRFGGTPLEALTALGDFTAQDLIDLLAQIETIGDRIDDGVDADGLTTSFQTFNQITAVQGSAIIAQLSTSNFFLREIMQNTAAFISAFGSGQIPATQPDVVESDTFIERVGDFAGVDLSMGEELEALQIGNGLPQVRHL